MLCAVQDEVVAILAGARLHAAQVGAGTGFGHGEAVPFLAPDTGIEVLLPLLLVPGQKDVRRSRDAGPVERIVGAAKLLFVKQPGQRIEARAADLLGQVGCVKTGLYRLGLQLFYQIHGKVAAAFDRGLMRVKFVLDEGARRRDDHCLFFGQSEIHELTPSFARHGARRFRDAGAPRGPRRWVSASPEPPARPGRPCRPSCRRAAASVRPSRPRCRPSGCG